jgi:uncharacterized protein YjbI with pentapeptide repeats
VNSSAWVEAGDLLPSQGAGIYFGIALVVIVLCGVAWWWVPRWQANRLRDVISDAKTRAEVEYNWRTSFGQFFAGIAVLSGAAFAYFQFKQTLNETELSRIGTEKSSRDLLVSQQVSKGFEQLGSDKLTVRLGGIYALEGVMNVSPEYHRPIIEALCAYVRERSNAAEPRSPIGTDLQAVVTVLGRRAIASNEGRLDLSNTRLPKAALVDAQLSQADLSHADLSGANLFRAKLRSAHLSQADLKGVELSEADLSDADLSTGAEGERGAHWDSGGSLDDVGADLSTSTLRSANLSRANLLLADLRYTNLSKANLSKANVDLANLSASQLPEADLSEAKLTYTDLSWSDLSKANLNGADLSKAKLSGANLSDARGLTQNQLVHACGDAETKLPSGLTVRPCNGKD